MNTNVHVARRIKIKNIKNDKKLSQSTKKLGSFPCVSMEVLMCTLRHQVLMCTLRHEVDV